eukprot:SAG31_NODE_339_length_17487_cov_20.764435_10_plen_148_part_00
MPPSLPMSTGRLATLHGVPRYTLAAAGAYAGTACSRSGTGRGEGLMVVPSAPVVQAMMLLAGCHRAMHVRAAAAGGECRFEDDTAYEAAASGDSWHDVVSTTSAGECCAICRSLPQCFVANYLSKPARLEGGKLDYGGAKCMAHTVS